MNTKSTAPAVPRASATILLLRDDPFEVLMVRRSNSGLFASALVFPGGLVEPEDRDGAWLPLLLGADDMGADARAHRIAAIREMWEEAAILLVEGGDGECPTPPPNPAAADFRKIVAGTGGKLDVGILHHFAHWITPVNAPKRYDTHFFVARAPERTDARCDGTETVALEWIQPEDALVRARSGVGAVMFPTRVNLVRLAESTSVADAIAAARQRPIVTVLPRVEPRQGGTVVMIPADAGYSVTEEFTRARPGDEDGPQRPIGKSFA
jgi:8-oxo-dGTP pyrophosphatase MutT (NUDIX family)